MLILLDNASNHKAKFFINAQKKKFLHINFYISLNFKICFCLAFFRLLRSSIIVYSRDKVVAWEAENVKKSMLESSESDLRVCKIVNSQIFGYERIHLCYIGFYFK